MSELRRIDCVAVDNPEFVCWQYKYEDYFNKSISFDNKDVYIIIGHGSLNYEALGQILAYKISFKEDWPKVNIKELVIVYPFGKENELVKKTCACLHVRTESIRAISGVETRLRKTLRLKGEKALNSYFKKIKRKNK